MRQLHFVSLEDKWLGRFSHFLSLDCKQVHEFLEPDKQLNTPATSDVDEMMCRLVIFFHILTCGVRKYSCFSSGPERSRRVF